MIAADVLDTLHDAGLVLELTAEHAVKVRPASLLNDDLRMLIRNHKGELVSCIQEAARVTAELLDAAMHACDFHNDTPKAREEMRRQCMEVPAHLRADLLTHFKATYPQPNKTGVSQKPILQRRISL